MNKKLIATVVSAALFFATAALADTKSSVVGAYFQVEHAVINGDLNAAKAAASDLAQKAQVANDDAIVKDANELAKAESIDQARQLFKPLSDDTLNLIQTSEGSQNMACATGSASTSTPQCMQTNARSSCMDAGMSSCGAMMNMMRRCMLYAGCGGMSG